MSSEASGDQLPRISVLIASRNRPAELVRCLASVSAIDYPDFEIVVIDQSEVDRTAVIQAEFADKRLRYLWQVGVGLSRARNAAMQEATGEILAFTDDDCTVPPNWLRRIAEVFSNEPQAGLVFGAFQAIPHDPAEFLVPSFSPPHYRRLHGRFASLFSDSEAGGNMAARRRVFDIVGEFDLYLGAGAVFPSGDDSDLSDRALQAGFVVVHDPANAVLHWGARAYSDGSARRLVLGNSFALGALLAKELRCGNPVAVLRLAWLFVTYGFKLAPAIFLRRPTGTARVLRAIAGFWGGLRQPLDHGARVFLPDLRSRG